MSAARGGRWNLVAPARRALTRSRTRLWDRVAVGGRVERMALHSLVRRTYNFHRTTWLGVPIAQNVLDLWVVQETISELKPALLIETGTYQGGSALFYANLMDLIGRGEVITIDIAEEQREQRISHSRITFVHGDSVDPEIVGRAAAAARDADGPVMVILDGDHDCDHVARELELYAPLVTAGSFLLSQDGVIDTLPDFAAYRPGPLRANREFLAAHPEFVHDRERNERYGLSHHPCGWMRRR